MWKHTNMMSTQDKNVVSLVREIFECSICKEAFQTPKYLPCIHTFCLECLEMYGVDERPGDEMPCPFCKQMFKVPTEGFKKLPNNIFIEQIAASEKQMKTGSPLNELNCEVCCKIVATKYCVECVQSMCSGCSITHGNLKIAQSHKVVSLADKEGSQEYMRARPAYCDTHKDKQLELYCYDCSRAICFMCSVVDHKPHHCEDIQKSSKLFSNELKSSCFQLNQSIENIASEQKLLEANKGSLLEQMSACKCAINEQGSEIKRLVDEQCSKLFGKLDEYVNEGSKKIQTRKNEVDRQLLMLSSLRVYVEELVEKGSACAISQSAKDLLARAEQLHPDQVEFSKGRLSPDRVTFEPASVTDITSGQMALIGSISAAAVNTRAGFRPNIKMEPVDAKAVSIPKFQPVFPLPAKKKKYENRTVPESTGISLDRDDDTEDTSANAKKPRLGAEGGRPAKKWPHHQVRDYLKCAQCQMPRCFYAEKSLKPDQRPLWTKEKERLKKEYKCGAVALFSSGHALASVVHAEEGVGCGSPVSVHYYGATVDFPCVCYTCGVSCKAPGPEVTSQFLSYHPVCNACGRNGKKPRTRNKTKKQDQSQDISD